MLSFQFEYLNGPDIKRLPIRDWHSLKKTCYTAKTAESVDFELADSSCRFHEIGNHFLGESEISEYIMYFKIRGIGQRILQSATGPLLKRKMSENDKINTFSCLSGR